MILGNTVGTWGSETGNEKKEMKGDKQAITVNKQLNLIGIPGKLFKTVASE